MYYNLQGGSRRKSSATRRFRPRRIRRTRWMPFAKLDGSRRSVAMNYHSNCEKMRIDSGASRASANLNSLAVPASCRRACEYRCMATPKLSELLKLPSKERAELALALWESLTDAERDAQFSLSTEDEAELDHRWAEHLRAPSSAIPWEEVRRKLLGPE
jgi:putative addiction module component (TIGR02574 family)